MSGFLNTMAAAGRNGDTTMAHMTPGEMVVPKEVAAMRPDLVKHIQGTIASYGVDPSRYVVGSSAWRNPATGAQEFATADEIAAAYQSSLGRAADPTEVSFWMNNQDAFANGGFTQGVANEKAATAQAAAATPAPAPSTGLDTSGSTTTTAPSPAPAPAAGTGFLAAAAPAPAASSATAAAPALDWSSIYRNNANRDASQADIDFWTGQAKTLGDAGAYSSFLTGLTANGETNAGLSLADANKAYTGDLTKDTAATSNVDEWARNLYGRDATDAEIAQYGNAADPATAQKNYDAFVAANGAPKTAQSIVQASQLSSPTAVNKSIASMLFPPNTNQQVDPATETIQGQLANILAVDANGNYTNQTVRQAYDRTMQTFAARGLLNTSVAAQAAQEAVIAQAINIAGPDAQTYATQALANQTAQNNFAQGEVQQGYTQANAAQQQGYTSANAAQQQGYTVTNTSTANANTLRQNYLSATASISDTYQRTVADINSSAMTPEMKTQAIANAASVRDGEMVYTNSLYSKQPQWQSEWLSMAVPTSNANIAGITNTDTLQNIINDPAQPAATVAAAKAQLTKVSLANQAALNTTTTTTADA